MSNHGVKPINITRWILLLILGLVLESCILALVAGTILARRGDLKLPDGILPQQTRQAAYQSPEDDNSIDQTAIPDNSKPNKRTQTASAARSENITATPIQLSETHQIETPLVWQNPPGGKIVYACFDGKFDQICLMAGDGTHHKQLTNISATNFYPSLSPDGNQIVFSSNRTGIFELYLMDIQGENLIQLTDHLGNLYAPAISPNGNRIVFTLESGGKQDIWVMRSDGNNPHPLTDTGGNIDPTWSPNGEQIAFTSDRNGINQLFTMNSNGNNPRSIDIPTAPKIGGRTSWSPSESKLAFYGGPGGDRNIYLVDLDGRNLLQLTSGGDNLAPSFSPDGLWLAFTSFRDGNNEIYIMAEDGSNQTRLTRNGKSDWQPRWGP